jgi:hypothetical protein
MARGQELELETVREKIKQTIEEERWQYTQGQPHDPYDYDLSDSLRQWQARRAADGNAD